MKKTLLLLAALLLSASTTLQAQGRRTLRINEVMVINDSSIVDEYGNHSAWIELFNTQFSPLEISSVYLTTDTTTNEAERKMYAVPIGDVDTRIPKRQHVLFYADNRPGNGTFHTNFVLVPGQDNWIGIYDADRKTLIDSVTVPASLPANASYARSEDGEGQWEIRDNSCDQKYITPSSNNLIKAENLKVIQFSEKDKRGFGLTIMAMCIVFSALLLLCICFYIVSTIAKKRSERRKMESQGISKADTPRRERPAGDSGEEIAAIVMALHDHLETHDKESTILTIKKLRRAYSPWNSKIYGLRELPQRPAPRRR